jgi:hypothetical protein
MIADFPEEKGIQDMYKSSRTDGDQWGGWKNLALPERFLDTYTGLTGITYQSHRYGQNRDNARCKLADEAEDEHIARNLNSMSRSQNELSSGLDRCNRSDWFSIPIRPVFRKNSGIHTHAMYSMKFADLLGVGS